MTASIKPRESALIFVIVLLVVVTVLVVMPKGASRASEPLGHADATSLRPQSTEAPTTVVAQAALTKQPPRDEDEDDSANVSGLPVDPDDAYRVKLRAIRRLCGSLCSFNTAFLDRIKNVSVEQLQAHPVRRPVSCPALFSQESEKVFDAAPLVWPPPQQIPVPLLDDFTLGGKATVGAWYWAQRYAGDKAKESVWTVERVSAIMTKAKVGAERGNYGTVPTTALFKLLDSLPFMKGAHVLVVGSEMPWVEALCLAAGAKQITTLEYGEIKSEDKRIATMTPHQFNAAFRAGTLPVFDVAVSYSSLEHSGLGRYGDGFNPWGDVIATARLSCVVKPGGHLVVAVPGSRQQDSVVYNAHRVYGPRRWALLMTNWHVSHISGDTVHLIGVGSNQRTH